MGGYNVLLSIIYHFSLKPKGNILCPRNVRLFTNKAPIPPDYNKVPLKFYNRSMSFTNPDKKARFWDYEFGECLDQKSWRKRTQRANLRRIHTFLGATSK